MKKKHFALTALVALVLVLGAYLTSYLSVRWSRLSLEHASSAMLFETEEEARTWMTDYKAGRITLPLMYGDNPLLYVIFWPAIHIDSAISGRDVESPSFGYVEPYVVPPSSPSLQLPPPSDNQDQAGE